MNLAFFLIPKNEVSFICENVTLKKAIDKMKRTGFTAMPVITPEGKYAGTVTNSDILFYMVDNLAEKSDQSIFANINDVCVKDILTENSNPSVYISSKVDELLVRAMSQNFVPVVDDVGSFIGIVTRQDVIRYFYNKTVEKEREG